MKQLLILLSIVCCGLKSLAQEERQNPIIYADMLLGGAWGPAGGLTAAGSLNYEHDKHLFSFRYIGNAHFSSGMVRTSPFTALPMLKKDGETKEYGLLYGRRIVNAGNATSFSIGVSHTRIIEFFENENGENARYEVSRVGIPYEISFRFFKKRKARHRIYYIIPVGKPTGFSRSIGVKLFGNISEKSYLGIGLTFGLGWHKQYVEENQ